MVIGILVLLLGITFFCSKKEEKTNRYGMKLRKTRSYEPVITKVELEPGEPTVMDDIKAIPTLGDSRMKHVKFQYQWFVNGDIIQGKEDSVLEKKYYKKGNEIYCRVKALKGIYESKIVKSREIEVKNSSPIIRLDPWNDVRMGEPFEYTINAFDPDNDPLTYRLVSPLDLGIELDQDTGKILWDTRNIPQPKPTEVETPVQIQKGSSREGDYESAISKTFTGRKKKRYIPSLIKIVFEVRDPDGAVVDSSIRFRLFKKGEEDEVGMPR
jgi:hypothetical protein